MVAVGSEQNTWAEFFVLELGVLERKRGGLVYRRMGYFCETVESSHIGLARTGRLITATSVHFYCKYSKQLKIKPITRIPRVMPRILSLVSGPGGVSGFRGLLAGIVSYRLLRLSFWGKIDAVFVLELTKVRRMGSHKGGMYLVDETALSFVSRSSKSDEIFPDIFREIRPK